MDKTIPYLPVIAKLDIVCSWNLLFLISTLKNSIMTIKLQTRALITENEKRIDREKKWHAIRISAENIAIENVILTEDGKKSGTLYYLSIL